MNISQYAKKRHASKAFDPSRKLPENIIAELRELIRFSPSSVNSQPWHFIVAASDEGKSRIAKAAENGYPYNVSKIRDASHVMVLCTRTALDDGHLATVLEQEDEDQRFINPAAKTAQHGSRQFYANLHRYDLKDAQHWMEKQLYLALGTLLLGAATLEIDTVPIEGFDARLLDEELGLRAKGLSSVVLVGLGYHSAEDFNAKLPKSRLPQESVFTDL
jgi:nitroreductase/dihydropteridine reductase